MPYGYRLICEWDEMFLQTYDHEKNFDASKHSKDDKKPLPIKKLKSYRHYERCRWGKNMAGLIGLRDKMYA